MSTCHHALSVRCGSVCANAFARLDSHTNQSSTPGRPLGSAAIAHRLRNSKYGGALWLRGLVEPCGATTCETEPDDHHGIAFPSTALDACASSKVDDCDASLPAQRIRAILGGGAAHTYTQLHTTRAKARILARGVRAHAVHICAYIAWQRVSRRSVCGASLRVRADRSSAYSGTLERAQPSRATGCIEDRPSKAHREPSHPSRPARSFRR
jgi:hypothetical protein